MRGSKEQLNEICNEARLYKSVIMYDLILNHLGFHSEQLRELEAEFLEIYNIKLTTIKIETEEQFFSDVKEFDYDQKIVRAFVFENLHRPLLDQLIKIGIRGFRIDAAAHINIDYQKKIAEYLSGEFRKISETCEIYIEHLFSGTPKVSRLECLECWKLGNLNISIANSSFLGLKPSEEEKFEANDYPGWIENYMNVVGHDTTCGMIGSHDEHNLHTKIATLICKKTIWNGYQKILYNCKNSERRRILFDGNNRDLRLSGPRLSDTDGILTIKNQIDILLGKVEGGLFRGFGWLNRKALIEIYTAYFIKILHSEIETNGQLLVNIGHNEDLKGNFGSHCVFSDPQDFNENKTRVLTIGKRFPELDITNLFMTMFYSKKTILSPWDLVEKIIIFKKRSSRISIYISYN